MIGEMTARADANLNDVRAYADHVTSCPICRRANADRELCADGGALWDAIDDDDRTDPAIILCGNQPGPIEFGGQLAHVAEASFEVTSPIRRYLCAPCARKLAQLAVRESFDVIMRPVRQ